MAKRQEQSAMVLRIEKSSIHDGEGIRTVVFLKGCNLRCRWCSTPESQNMEAELEYGRLMTVSQVLKEVLKDEIFYFHSGGGLTISGGEPLLQADFVTQLLEECRFHGISRAMETSFHRSWPQIEPVLRQLNTLFVDIKHMDNKAHQRLTGLGNQLILDNIRRAAALSGQFGIIVRTPLIPGLNDDEENLRQTAAFVTGLNKLQGFQLLPYHRLGSGTYAKLGREYELKEIPLPDVAYMEEKYQLIRRIQPGLPLI